MLCISKISLEIFHFLNTQILYILSHFSWSSILLISYGSNFLWNSHIATLNMGLMILEKEFPNRWPSICFTNSWKMMAFRRPSGKNTSKKIWLYRKHLSLISHLEDLYAKFINKGNAAKVFLSFGSLNSSQLSYQFSIWFFWF